MVTELSEFYSKAYNSSARIPDADRYFPMWSQQSEAARAALNCRLDIPYGDDATEKLDLFFAEESTRWLLFIHGGYWRSMDKRDYSCIAPNFVAAGINVAVINYALCPQVTIATITEQCRRRPHG